MPREKADYRDLLERLDRAFPERETVTRTELAAWMGVSPRTIARRYSLPQGRSVLKTTAARAISGS